MDILNYSIALLLETKKQEIFKTLVIEINFEIENDKKYLEQNNFFFRSWVESEVADFFSHMQFMFF